MEPKRNIAARAGAWSARHRRVAIVGWMVFVVMAFALGGKVGTNTLTQEESGVGDSGRADRIVGDAYPDRVEEMVLVHSDTLKSGDPQFRAAVADVTHRLDAVDGAEKITAGEVSPDGHSRLVQFEIPGDSTDTGVAGVVDASVAAVDASVKANPGLRIEQSGEGSSEDEFQEVFTSDLAKAGATSLPLTLIILLVAFGALVAAGVPLLLAVTGVLGTLGLVGPISQIAPVADGVNHVILLIGLAVGVDYALFYLRRYREERAAGRESGPAVEAAAATSGRAVLISGLTVMVAMAGMYFGGAADFSSFATGTIAVVAVAMIGSLTVLPALLASLGDKVERGRIPGMDRLRSRVGRIGIWSRVVDRVMRRPLRYAVVSTALLVALAVPALHMETGTPSTDTLPQDLAVVQKFQHLQDAFPHETAGVDLVVKAGDVTDPAVQRGIAELQRTAMSDQEHFPGTARYEQRVSPDRTVVSVSVPIAGDGMDDESKHALEVLREDVVPATIDDVGGVQAYVTGGPAPDVDFADTMKSHMPIVFAFVLSAAFLLLLITFRSIVVPLKAIALNLLSVGAAYGAMVLVFQHGWLKQLLGFEVTGPIESWIPMFLFVVLFGLSMDYHVFILSRVRELYDKGMKTEDAVPVAIKSTAGVVTSAALVMVGVFSVFGMLSWMMFKQMGVGLAFAVLLDATIIRGVLLPASMKLLGDRNWWLPRRLSWLPRVAPEREAAPQAA